MLETSETEQEEKENVTCIFGKTICDPCPVRQELSRKPLDMDVSKYIESTNPQAKIFADSMNQFMEPLLQAFKEEKSKLANFCRSCPYLYLFELKG